MEMPQAWPDRAKRPNDANSPFPKGFAQPAVRALASVGVTRFEQAAKFTERELAALHGMGPKALAAIKAALADQSMSFAPET